jgi:DNA primase
MNIYDYVFGVSCGQVQVQCCFHDDTKASAGISPDLQYNCFACGAKANNDLTFIKNYFYVGDDKALKIQQRLDVADKYKPTKNKVTAEQRQFLNSIGITNEVIDQYFYCQGNGKLILEHTWNGLPLGTTWFNSPLLSNWNAGAEKYKYQGIIGGLCTPYDDVCRYNSILITEGEKDMLTAKSFGIKSAVAKLGGAITPLIGGVNFNNKSVVLIYDCDEPGRKGAEKDAAYLIDRHACKVKIVDLGLQEKEDLNDYFIKYNHTVQDLYALIKATPEYVVPPEYKQSRVEKFLSSLSPDELTELKNKIKETE